jgi:hypothetical protein
MNREIITKVEVLDTGELFLALKGTGNPNYQYVYREAAGVYWDENKKGFKSTTMKEWSCSKWFDHIVKTVFVALDVELKLGSTVTWINIPEEQKNEIQCSSN